MTDKSLIAKKCYENDYTIPKESQHVTQDLIFKDTKLLDTDKEVLKTFFSKKKAEFKDLNHESFSIL